jgi:hypothetical protein
MYKQRHHQSITSPSRNLNKTTSFLLMTDLARSPPCEAVHRTLQFDHVCQENFLSQYKCQKLSDAPLKIRSQWNSALTSYDSTKTNGSVFTCKTLWITGISMGFEATVAGTKKHQVADRGDGYRVQYATALHSAQQHASHILQPVVILLTPPQSQMSESARQSIHNYTDWLERRGVIVSSIRRLSFQEMIYQAYPDYVNGAIAYYLPNQDLECYILVSHQRRHFLYGFRYFVCQSCTGG